MLIAPGNSDSRWADSGGARGGHDVADSFGAGEPMLVGAVTITVLYDNIPRDPRLQTAWGFAALVEHPSGTYLFDTGGDGRNLLNNMRVLGVDLGQIDAIVLSHAHGDHTGGLIELLDRGIRPPVFLLPSFPAEFKRQVAGMTAVVETEPGVMVGEGVYVTGEVPGGVPEQAMIVETEAGLAVVTGCAHPGVVTLVSRAKDLVDGSVHLVIGGFHLREKSTSDVQDMVTALRRHAVEQVAPTHCTGDRAVETVRADYGEDCVQAGLGSVITVAGR
jgi:7,8-dihydropterin-6-yl-methyl-4-(beta-D-ribofuranosyl)aminobenzene 5'-phosphate synthase